MVLSKVDQAERDMERCLCTPAEHVGRVTTPLNDGEASVWVCDLIAHREAAERWVRACTGRAVVAFVPRRES